MGDATSGPIRLSFNPQLRDEFRGATVTSDAGLMPPRELDERLGLSALIERICAILAPDTTANSLKQISSASPTITAWRATKTRMTPNAWPRTQRFGCWLPASGEKRASRSPRRSTGLRRTSSLRSGTTKDSLVSIRP